MFHFLLNPYVEPSKANYQHACVVFAEGLKTLGHAFTANIEYYPDPSGNPLFKKGELQPEDYIVTSAPEDFAVEINANPNKLVILDTKDEWVRPKSLAFLPRAHRYFMSTCVNAKQTKPTCFALSNRMLEATAGEPAPWKGREKPIVWSHRVDNHYIRNLVFQFYTRSSIQLDTFLDNFTDKTLSEADAHYWAHTGRRHSPFYFDFLRKHRFLDAHGGYQTQVPNRIAQWDSWKVWEGFLSGMLVITADLDYYNIKLPHKLLPYVHYIPIRYDKIGESYHKLFLLPEAEQERIAKAGQEFVRTHYTPSAMAKYYVDIITT
jgi:hypothetical protein